MNHVLQLNTILRSERGITTISTEGKIKLSLCVQFILQNTDQLEDTTRPLHPPQVTARDDDTELHRNGTSQFR